MCRCINCGKPTDCGEKLCPRCFIDCTRDDETSKNLKQGGRFYGEKLLPGDTVEAKEDK